MKRSISLILVVLLIASLACTSMTFAASKSITPTKNFYGVHTDYGASVWGIRFCVKVNYTNSSKPYKLKKILVSAYMYPKHTYGTGDIILGSLKQQVDSGSWLQRNIKPTPNSFWSQASGIYPSPSKIYFDLEGTTNRSFSSTLKEKGEFTFSVPNVYFPYPDCSMTLTVNVPS